MSYNNITITGNIGRDGELKYTPQGVALCEFSVAVGKVSGKGEQRTETTTWFKCTLWRERAEALAPYLKKGTKVLVAGELSASAYMNKEDKPVASLEINVREIDLLGSRQDSEAGEGTPRQDGGRPKGRPPKSSGDLDEIPF